ncbi:MAG: dTMP kinase [Acidimicrobiales bacterium]|jgi:dTMP kinase
MKKAQIIVIDGGDNVGKATQADLLMRHLVNDGIPVGKLDFPRYHQNTFGHLIRECLDGEHGNFLLLDPKIAATLYAADRYESKNELLQWVEEGRVIILDRYVSANMLHQGAKINDPDRREEFLRWLDHVEYEIFGMPRPDLTVYLDMPPDKSQKLLEYVVGIGAKVADMAESDKDHQKKVAECAKYLSSSRDQWVTVQCMGEGNALRTREDIHEEVYKVVKKHL